MEDADAVGTGAGRVGRPVYALPLRGRLVLLAGLRNLRRGGGERCDRVKLLFVHHTVSPATHALQLAALSGLRLSGVDFSVRPALTASATDVLSADGYLLGSPVNLGY